jgi:chromosome segregation ATPase
LSTLEWLKAQREELMKKLGQAKEMVGKGMSWKDSQFYVEKYTEEIRVLDNKVARLVLGEDVLSELREKKAQLSAKLDALEGMKKRAEISDKVYKEKKKDIGKEIEQVERDLVEKM